VDSFAVTAITGTDSEWNFFADVWLIVHTKDGAGSTGQRQYLLNFAYRTIQTVDEGGRYVYWVEKQYPHFEPGSIYRFTVDTMGMLRLDEIVGCALLVGGDRLKDLPPEREYGQIWRPDAVQLEVNGQLVVNLSTTG
jgi:hypothetical protein